jgi:nucleotide-binding universal stress UspA family protein
MDLHYKRLVVPVGGTVADERALALVQHLVHKQPVTLTLIYVVEVAQSMALDAELPGEVTRGEAALREAERFAKQTLGGKAGHIVTELLQARSAGAAVVDEAIDRHADAIVMTAGIHRRHGRPTLGETTNYVLMHAPCEVLLARAAPVETGEDGTSR